MRSGQGGFQGLIDELADEIAGNRPALAKALWGESPARPDEIRAAAARSPVYVRPFPAELVSIRPPPAPHKPILFLQRPAPTKEEQMTKAIGMTRDIMGRALAQHAAGQITVTEVSKLEEISNRTLQAFRARLG